MNVRSLLMALVFVFAQAAFSSELDTCVKTVLSHTKLYRIDKEESIKNCFELNKNKLNQDVCFEKAKNIRGWMHSSKLQTQMTSTCFYDTQPFKNVSSCLNATKNFTLAGDHDEAVFYCYQTFQENLNQDQCITVANQMVFPAKKDYLKRHCLQN